MRAGAPSGEEPSRLVRSPGPCAAAPAVPLPAGWLCPRSGPSQGRSAVGDLGRALPAGAGSRGGLRRLVLRLRIRTFTQGSAEEAVASRACACETPGTVWRLGTVRVRRLAGRAVAPRYLS